MNEASAPQYSPEEQQAVDEFEAALKRLIGLTCWSVLAGDGTGSAFSMDLGERVPRKRPLTNPYLTNEQQNFIGEYAVFVDDCLWRVEHGNDIVTSWNDDNANDGPMVRGLESVIGRTVKRVELRRPGLDLSVHFNNGSALQFFCDRTSSEEHTSNYTFFVPGKYYHVGSRSQLEIKRDRK